MKTTNTLASLGTIVGYVVAAIISLVLLLYFVISPFMERRANRKSDLLQKRERELNLWRRKVRYLTIKTIRLALEPTITGAELARKCEQISIASVFRGIAALGLFPATIEAWADHITPYPDGDDVVVFSGTLVRTPAHLKGVGYWAATAIQSPDQGDIETSIPLGCDIYDKSLVAVVEADSPFAGKFPEGA